MGEMFIKYKGAEAGEIDWRPTETRSRKIIMRVKKVLDALRVPDT